METNQPSNMNNSYDSQLINIRQEDTSVNMKTSVNVSKNNNKEQILNMELKNIQMLILQRSLYILKKKFEIFFNYKNDFGNR